MQNISEEDRHDRIEHLRSNVVEETDKTQKVNCTGNFFESVHDVEIKPFACHPEATRSGVRGISML